MNRRVLSMLAAAATFGVAQACGSTSSPATLGHPPSSTHGTIANPAHQVDVRLELHQTRVTAGAPLRGVLIVDNLTQSRIKTPCGFKFAVGLTKDHMPFEPAFTLECQINQSVPVGVTRYPITIITTYESCSQSGKPDGAVPGCLPGPMGAGSSFTVPPLLPTGAYLTAVVINGIPSQDIALAAPITVTLT